MILNSLMYTHPRKTKHYKKKTYTKIELLIEEISNRKIKILLGDMNTKISKERLFRPTIGTHSLHDITNDNRSKVMTLAIGKDLTKYEYNVLT